MNINSYFDLFFKKVSFFFLFLTSKVGFFVLNFTNRLGSVLFFLKDIFISLFSRQIFFLNFCREFFLIGFNTIPLISITSFFTGAVLVLQLYQSFEAIGITRQIPSVVFFSIARDLIPILSGLMIVARVGSSIASEISYMKSSNQLDVLKSMSVNHFRFLLFPKLFSLIFSATIIYLFSFIFGLMGSYFIAVNFINFSPYEYILLLNEAFSFEAIFKGFIKLELFSISTVLISYYLGFNADKDKTGIIASVLKTVIFGSISILFLNFFIVYFLK